MGNQPEKSVYQLSNEMWAFRYCVRINGKNVCRRSSKDKDGNPLKTKRDALRARKQAISCVQNPPEPVKTDEIIKRTTVPSLRNIAKKDVPTAPIIQSSNKTAFGKII